MQVPFLHRESTFFRGEEHQGAHPKQGYPKSPVQSISMCDGMSMCDRETICLFESHTIVIHTYSLYAYLVNIKQYRNHFIHYW